jgi:hypothetical protein
MHRFQVTPQEKKDLVVWCSESTTINKCVVYWLDEKHYVSLDAHHQTDPQIVWWGIHGSVIWVAVTYWRPCWGALHTVPLTSRLCLYFQQEGAPVHFSSALFQWFDLYIYIYIYIYIFSGWWIGPRNGHHMFSHHWVVWGFFFFWLGISWNPWCMITSDKALLFSRALSILHLQLLPQQYCNVCILAHGIVLMCEQQYRHQFEHLTVVNVRAFMVFHVCVWLCHLGTFSCTWPHCNNISAWVH